MIDAYSFQSAMPISHRMEPKDQKGVVPTATDTLRRPGGAYFYRPKAREWIKIKF